MPRFMMLSLCNVAHIPLRSKRKVGGFIACPPTFDDRVFLRPQNETNLRPHPRQNLGGES